MRLSTGPFRIGVALLGCVVLAAGLPSGLSAQDKQPFTTEDALNVATLRVQDITDDGRYIAATRATDRDRKNVDHMRFGDPTYISPSYADVLVLDTETGTQTSLFDRKVQVRSFQWSPDGTMLAFFVRDGDEYFLHTYEPARDRVRKIDLKSDLTIASNSPLIWQPDGGAVILTLRAEGWAETSRQMYLALEEGPTIVQDSRKPFLAWDVVRGQSALMIPATVNTNSRDVQELLPETRITRIRPSDDGRLISYVETTPVKTAYDRRGGAEYEVLVLDLAADTTYSVREKSTTRINPNWNSTGDAFAYADEGNVFVRSIRDTVARNLTEEHRTPVSEDDTTKLRYGLMSWRPDDGALLVSSQKGYHLLDAESGDIQLVYATTEDDESAPDLSVVNWSRDGGSLYMTYSAKDRWERGLVRYDLPAERMSDLVKDASRYTGWRFSEDGEKIFYNFSDGDRPNDLYMANRDFSETTRLTDLNPWLAEHSLTRSELIEYLDVDGKTLYGILYYPVDHEPGKRYPLVAEIYEEFFHNGFNTNMNLLANAGFFGFRPSANLETGFPGEGWLKGVTAGINKLIERGLVDEDRLGVHGTSYGGYATNLLITQTKRFAAAINISGKVNIISFLGDSPKITNRNYAAAEVGQDRIGATLWEQPQKYLAHSAILYADRIETPLLMLTGEGDWNVPATNQREMYYALRRLEKEVVWVHYMNAGHGAGRSSTVEDFHDHWNRIIGWYNEHFEKADEERVTADGDISGGVNRRP
ncbi:MAG: prolyl oligopeptidase family serine peptidase [Gemmatimonadetes bacterium]|nr:prolyl oligopeptidase family serine peptidase [Gemmatimonadota bacterium]